MAKWGQNGGAASLLSDIVVQAIFSAALPSFFSDRLFERYSSTIATVCDMYIEEKDGMDGWCVGGMDGWWA